mgnify:CR=1 FL=1
MRPEFAGRERQVIRPEQELPLWPALPAQASLVRGGPESSYDSSSITVLEGLTAVRKRPSMYIGSTSERGLHHLVWEVVDNSVDEALCRFCRPHRGGAARGRRRASGRQRPRYAGGHASDQKRPAVEVILTVLHSGGKSSTARHARSVRRAARGGCFRRQRAVSPARGPDRQGRLRVVPALCRPEAGRATRPRRRTTKTGTTVTFWADPAIFETTTYSFETISRRLQEMAFLNKGLTIVLRDERPERPPSRMLTRSRQSPLLPPPAVVDRGRSPTTTREGSRTSSGT